MVDFRDQLRTAIGKNGWLNVLHRNSTVDSYTTIFQPFITRIFLNQPGLNQSTFPMLAFLSATIRMNRWLMICQWNHHNTQGWYPAWTSRRFTSRNITYRWSYHPWLIRPSNLSLLMLLIIIIHATQNTFKNIQTNIAYDQPWVLSLIICWAMILVVILGCNQEPSTNRWGNNLNYYQQQNLKMAQTGRSTNEVRRKHDSISTNIAPYFGHAVRGAKKIFGQPEIQQREREREIWHNHYPLVI